MRTVLERVELILKKGKVHTFIGSIVLKLPNPDNIQEWKKYRKAGNEVIMSVSNCFCDVKALKSSIAGCLCDVTN